MAPTLLKYSSPPEMLPLHGVGVENQHDLVLGVIGEALPHSATIILRWEDAEHRTQATHAAQSTFEA